MRLKIFVIDDETGVLKLLKIFLERLGHDVVTAPEAVLCNGYYDSGCKVTKPWADLLFIDYKMPNMTGLDFINIMNTRGCEGMPRDKYIMTGSISEIDMKLATRLGVNVFEKPFHLSQIAEIVEEVKNRIISRDN